METWYDANARGVRPTAEGVEGTTDGFKKKGVSDCERESTWSLGSDMAERQELDRNRYGTGTARDTEVVLD